MPTSEKLQRLDAYITDGVFQAATHNFPAKVPSTVSERTLTASVGATLTFTAAMGGVPEGVNGTDTNHYLYISGGVGTAETVLITGGTATSGAASGTITFTPANNHSGTWTIQSATGGIQEAINAAAAATSISKVHIGPGTITLRNGAFISIPSTIHISGDGINRTIIQVEATSAANTKVMRNADQTNGNTQIILENFTIDGNKANQAAYPQGGIIFSKVTNSIIRNVEVKGTAGGPGFGVSGIEWTTNPNTSNTDNLVEGCSLHDNGTNGTNKADGLAIGGVRVRVIGNSLRSNQDSGIGLQGNTTSDIVITGNQIDGNSIGGIAMGANGSTQGDNSRIVITGNNVRANGDNIFIQRANDVNVTGNVVASSSGSGNVDGITVISVKGLVISGNRIFSNQGNGILLNDTNAADIINDAIISGNSVFSNNQTGIRLTVTNAGATMRDVVIANNTCTANSQSPANTVDGILITPLATTDIVGLVVSGNTVSDNQGVATQRYGLAFGTGPTKVAVMGNTAFGNATGSFSQIPADARVAANYDASASSTGDQVTVGDGTSLAASSARYIDLWGRDGAGNYRKARLYNEGSNFWFGDSGSTAGFQYDAVNGHTYIKCGGAAKNVNLVPSASGGVFIGGTTPTAPTVGAGQLGLGGVTQATIGANGAASALTANPVGYLVVNIGGSNRIIPFYNP